MPSQFNCQHLADNDQCLLDLTAYDLLEIPDELGQETSIATKVKFVNKQNIKVCANKQTGNISEQLSVTKPDKKKTLKQYPSISSQIDKKETVIRQNEDINQGEIGPQSSIILDPDQIVDL